VPSDVAVKQPGARIVGAESDGEEAVSPEDGSVATRRVVEVKKFVARRLVPRLVALCENDEVAAMEMDRVSP
jgi:hypothetical protein